MPAPGARMASPSDVQAHDVNSPESENDPDGTHCALEDDIEDNVQSVQPKVVTTVFTFGDNLIALAETLDPDGSKGCISKAFSAQDLDTDARQIEAAVTVAILAGVQGHYQALTVAVGFETGEGGSGANGERSDTWPEQSHKQVVAAASYAPI